MTILRRTLMISAACLLAIAPTQAAMMNYGTFTSDTVDFIDVTEDNLETSLFYDVQGAVGDVLLIDPDGFAVQKNPGPGASFLDSELEMVIMAHDGEKIDFISLTEEGDYTVTGDARVDATMAYFWQILEVDNVAITPISGSGSTMFTTSTPGTGELWDLGFHVDLDAVLAGEGMTGGVTKASFRFDNSLVADAADDLSVAFIKKKQLGGVQVMVPEPAGLLSACFGLLGLLGLRRR